MKTFKQMYQEAVEAPTPREAFLERIATLTGHSVYTVQSWAKGKRNPDLCAKKIIADELGTTIEALFPETEDA